MELSLGRQLDSYINPVTLNMDDSLSSIQNYQKLQNYFKIQKQRNAKRIYDLEQRLQQCMNVYSSLEKSVDQTYSRINEEKKTIDMERYEDLLHYTFKEIQWAKSSRIMITGDVNIAKSVEKFENDLSCFQSKRASMEKSYNEAFQQFDDRIEVELNEINEKAAVSHKQSMDIFDSLQVQIQKVQSEFDEQLQQLEKELGSSNTVCISIISNRIGDIEQQMEELTRHQSHLN